MDSTTEVIVINSEEAVEEEVMEEDHEGHDH
jgi:hypothetical protein